LEKQLGYQLETKKAKVKEMTATISVLGWNTCGGQILRICIEANPDRSRF
jgi:hypothetical protein